MVGQTVAHYRVLEQLGSGGMGIVYLADDLTLHRKVALKFLAAAGTHDSQAEARLRREAIAASALDHPNVATVYEIGEWEGRTFVAMAYYAGETLRARIAHGPVPISEATALVAQMADGLAAAHASGIVHRDLKPANVIVTTSGQIKILDFGLAHKVAATDEETALTLTAAGSILGTLAYMAPEQMAGAAVDGRADVWALGVVAYELVTGRRPFEGDSVAGQAVAVATRAPTPVGELRPDTPPALERVIVAALEKDPAKRTITAAEIGQSLRTLAPAVRPRRLSVAAVAIAIAVVAGAASAWWVLSARAERNAARAEAPGQIAALADRERFVEGYELLQRVKGHLDPTVVERLQALVTIPVSVTSTPAGATLTYAEYGAPESARRTVGTTPLTNVAVPRGFLVWRLEKPGFDPHEDVVPLTRLEVVLRETGKGQPGFVRVPDSPGVAFSVDGVELASGKLPAFEIGRSEVTNRDYKAFVDAGGYANRAYWTHEFRRDGKVLDWESGLALFRDVTGRPGPAAWDVGRYPAGQDDFPVTGVSWYEAAAFAAFSKASLPTLHHFRHVGGPPPLFPLIVPFAVFSKSAPLATGSSSARHRFGTFDLAGNVKEWSLTEGDRGQRFTLGGGWDEPPYMFAVADARSPFERAANIGFRLARYAAGDASPTTLAGPLVLPREFPLPKPASDSVFEAYARAFVYDRTPITDVVTEAVDTSPLDWTRETVTFPAAYGRERVTVHLLIPKAGRPPYQPVIFMPGGTAWGSVRSSKAAVESPVAGFVARSGRVLVIPILEGMYERADSDPEFGSTQWRDIVVADSKDLGRVVDYLQTRSDLAHDRIGYLGSSRGAAYGALFLSLEKRIKAAVFWIPGFYRPQTLPEVNLVHFVPRMTQPVLVLNGRADAIFPEATSQVAFFNALGTPPALKHRILYDSGHNLPVNDRVKETLAWFDLRLGAVK